MIIGVLGAETDSDPCSMGDGSDGVDPRLESHWEGIQGMVRNTSSHTAHAPLEVPAPESTNHDTMLGSRSGRRNLESTFAAGGQGSRSELEYAFAAEEEDEEEQAAQILAVLQQHMRPVPGAMIMVASELLGRGLDPSAVVQLLHCSALKTDTDAMRLFHALQREAAHERAAAKAEAVDATEAVDRLDPTGEVDVPSFVQPHAPYSPAYTWASGSGGGSDDLSALRSNIEDIVATSRREARDAAFARAVAAARSSVPPFVMAPVSELLRSCNANNGDAEVLLDAFLASFRSDAAMPWTDACATAIGYISKGCRPLVAWALAVEQYHRAQVQRVGEHGVLLPSGEDGQSLIDLPLPSVAAPHRGRRPGFRPSTRPRPVSPREASLLDVSSQQWDGTMDDAFRQHEAALAALEKRRVAAALAASSACEEAQAAAAAQHRTTSSGNYLNNARALGGACGVSTSTPSTTQYLQQLPAQHPHAQSYSFPALSVRGEPASDLPGTPRAADRSRSPADRPSRSERGPSPERVSFSASALAAGRSLGDGPTPCSGRSAAGEGVGALLM